MLDNHFVGNFFWFAFLSFLKCLECEVFVSVHGTDTINCGNITIPCQTLLYAYQLKVETSDVVMIMNDNCDQHMIQETILLSSTINVKGIEKNGCFPTLTSNKNIPAFGIKVSSKQIDISIENIILLDIGLIAVKNKPQAVNMAILNCSIKSMTNHIVLDANPANDFMISIYNTTFISSEISITGHHLNPHKNIVMKIIDSKLANNSTIRIINANTFILNGCRFNKQSSHYIIHAERVQNIQMNDIIIQDIKGFIVTKDCNIKVYGLTIKNTYANVGFFHSTGGNFTAFNVTITNGRCRSIFQSQYHNLFSITAVTIRDVFSSLNMLQLSIVDIINMKGIQIVNGSAGRNIFLAHYGKSASLSNISMDETRAKGFLLHLSLVNNVNMKGILIMNGLAGRGGVYILRGKSALLSNISTKDIRVMEHSILMVHVVDDINMNAIEIVKGLAGNGGVDMIYGKSATLSNISIKATGVRTNFMYSMLVDNINMKEIEIVSGTADDIVKVSLSGLAILSSIVIQNVSCSNVMFNLNNIKTLDIANLYISNSKTSQLISFSEKLREFSRRVHSNKNGTFYSTVIATKNEEYSRNLTVNKLMVDYPIDHVRRRRREIDNNDRVSKFHLRNVVLKNITFDTGIKAVNMLLWIKTFFIDHSKSGKVFDIEGGTVTLSDINITCYECFRAKNSNVTIENSNFNTMKSAVYYRSDSNCSVTISINNFHIVLLAKMQFPIFEIDAKLHLNPSVMNFTNLTILCSNNSYPDYELKTTDASILTYFCKACRKGTYIITDQPTKYSLNTFSNFHAYAEHSNNTSEFITMSLSYHVSRSKTKLILKNSKAIVCRSCPSGGTCVENILSNDNYWGFLNSSTGTVKFFSCPNGYCCSNKTKRCESYSTCNHHRHGYLCSKCQYGYSVDYFSSKCLPAKTCENPIYFWLLFFISVFLYILGVGYLDKLRDISSFLKKIIHRITCHKLFRNNEHIREDEANTRGIELRQYNDIRRDGDIHTTANIQSVHPNEIAALKEEEEDRCRWAGIFNVLVTFFQLKQLMTIELEYKHSSSKINQFFMDLFNLELITPTLRLCPSLQFNDFEKHVMKDLVVSAGLILPTLVTALTLHTLHKCKTLWNFSDRDAQRPLIECSLNDDADEIQQSEDVAATFQSKDVYESDSNPDKISFLCRCYTCFLRLLTMRYKNLAAISLVMIHCVTVGNVDILYIYGEIPCLNIGRYLAIAFMGLWIIPFPVSLFLSLKLLKENLITVEKFLAFMVVPAVVPFCYVLISYRNVHCLIEDNNQLKSSVAELFEKPYRSDGDKTIIYWHSWLLIQRMIVAYLIVFYIDPISRLSMVFIIMVFFQLIQLKVKPYKDSLVNNLEAVSTSILIIFAGVNMLRSVLYVYRIENDESITKVLEIYDAIDPLLNPIFFLLLFFIYVNVCKLWRAIHLLFKQIIRKKTI